MGAILSSIGGLFFPAKCRVCEIVIDEITRVPVCDACWSAIEPLHQSDVCQTCGVPGTGIVVEQCTACTDQPPTYLVARSYGLYAGTLREILHLLKYNKMEALAGPLGKRAASASEEVFAGCEAIVSVPLDSTRQRERGYNQSSLIAAGIAKRMKLPVLSERTLVRTRPTPPQSGLTRLERRDNMRDAFAADRGLVNARTILLVDDVMTTGATLDACSSALIAAGAKEVLALTVARTPLHEVS